MEMAVMMASTAGLWRTARLRYEIPDKDSLVTSRLLGFDGGWFRLGTERARGPRVPPPSAANPALVSLRRQPRTPVVALGEQAVLRGIAQRGGSARSDPQPLAPMDDPGQLAEDHADEAVEELGVGPHRPCRSSTTSGRHHCR